MNSHAAPAPLFDHLRRNLELIRSAMAEAAGRRGRRPEAVRLVAVTKSVGLGEIAALAALGQRDFGENRPEQLIARSIHGRAAGWAANWHMIGHLQRRKVRDLLPHLSLVHSVESLRLAEEMGKRAATMVHFSAPPPGTRDSLMAEAAGVPPPETAPVPILLEVNVSGEESKQGLRPAELAEVARQLADWPHLELRGLMTMAPLTAEAELVRPVFRGLRELLDRLNDAAAYPRPLTELSMGMSQDYVVAIEEGATLVRIGTAIFQP